jgi:hypothetical protein
MAVSFTPSNEFLNLATAIDLTSSPQLLLTNSSTYTASDNLTTVATEEVSGFGYARINLTVLSNSVQPGGGYKIIYNPASLTPSGGAITFDRLVLISGTNWIGYWDYKADNGGTAITIANAQTYPFKGLTIARGSQGTQINGANGEPAYTTSSASFVQPALAGTVSVTVGQTSFMAVGSYVFIDDGTNQSQYKVTAIGSATNVTLQRTTNEVSTGTTITSGASIVPTGANGSTPDVATQWTLELNAGSPGTADKLGTNSATTASITTLYVSETDFNSLAISSVLDVVFDDSILILSGLTSGEKAYFSLDSQVDSGTYRTYTVTHISSTGNFTDAETVNVGIIPSASAITAGHVIQDTGTPLTQRSSLNFVGATVTDDSGNDATVVTIPQGGLPIFNYSIVLALGTFTPNSGEWGTDSATTASITAFNIHETDLDSLTSGILAAVTTNTWVKLQGLTSGTIAFFIFDATPTYGSPAYTVAVTHRASTGDFTDTEIIYGQLVIV